jgi:hypothetical protein
MPRGSIDPSGNPRIFATLHAGGISCKIMQEVYEVYDDLF